MKNIINLGWNKRIEKKETRKNRRVLKNDNEFSK